MCLTTGNNILHTIYIKVIYIATDLKVVDEVRAQIPTINQRRTDLYDTIWKGKD